MADELGIAFQKFGNSAKAANIPMEKAMAWTAIISSQTRESAETIGNSLKSILARYRQIKEKGMSEEDGTKLNMVTKALASVGIQAVDSTGQLRNLADVLEELGPIYKRLDETSKAFIATQLFGTYQSARGQALLENYDKVGKLAEDSLQNAGIAHKKYLIWLDSTEAKVNTLKNAMTEFYMAFYNDDSIKGVIEILKEFIDSLTSITKTLGGVTTAVLVFTTAITALQHTKMQAIGSTLLATAGEVGSRVRESQAVVGVFGQSQSSTQRTQRITQLTTQRNALTGGGIGAPSPANIALLRNIDEELLSIQGHTQGATTGFSRLRAGIASAGIALKELSAAFVPMLIIGAGIGYAVQKIAEIKQTVSVAKDYVKSEGENYQNVKDSLQANMKEMTTLKKLQEEGTASEGQKTRLLEVNNEIATQIPDLVDKYDKEGNAIIKVGNAYDSVIEKKQKLADLSSETIASDYDWVKELDKQFGSIDLAKFSTKYFGDETVKSGKTALMGDKSAPMSKENRERANKVYDEAFKIQKELLNEQFAKNTLDMVTNNGKLKNSNVELTESTQNYIKALLEKMDYEGKGKKEIALLVDNMTKLAISRNHIVQDMMSGTTNIDFSKFTQEILEKQVRDDAKANKISLTNEEVIDIAKQQWESTTQAIIESRKEIGFTADELKNLPNALKGTGLEKIFEDMKKSSSEFYQQAILGSTDVQNAWVALVNNLGSNYNIDLKNFSSLAQAKLEIENQLLSRLGEMWKQYVVFTADGIAALEIPVDYSDPESVRQKSAINRDQYSSNGLIQSQVQEYLDEYNKGIQAFNNAKLPTLSANVPGADDANKDNEKSKEVIDQYTKAIEKINKLLEYNRSLREDLAKDSKAYLMSLQREIQLLKQKETLQVSHTKALKEFYKKEFGKNPNDSIKNQQTLYSKISKGNISGSIGSGNIGQYEKYLSGDLKNLDVDFANQLVALSKGIGKQIKINYGYRTYEEQEKMYKDNPTLAAKPGTSRHEKGLAADIEGRISDTILKKYGLISGATWKTSEPWHIQQQGKLSDNLPAISRQALTDTEKDAQSTIDDIVTSTNEAYDTAREILKIYQEMRRTIVDLYNTQLSMYDQLSGLMGRLGDSQEAISTNASLLAAKYSLVQKKISEIKNVLQDVSITDAERAQYVSELNQLYIDQFDITSQLSELQEKQKNYNQQQHLQDIQNTIKGIELSLQPVLDMLTALKTKFDLLADTDFTSSIGVLNDMLSTGYSLIGDYTSQFNSLANTIPKTAEEAELLAQQMSTMADAIVQNEIAMIEYRKQLIEKSVSAITAPFDDKISQLKVLQEYASRQLQNIEKYGTAGISSISLGDVAWTQEELGKAKKTEAEQAADDAERIYEIQKELQEKLLDMQKEANDLRLQEQQDAQEKELELLEQGLQAAAQVLANSIIQRPGIIDDNTISQIEQLQRLAEQLAAAFGMSQEEIAKLFGITEGGLDQLFGILANKEQYLNQQVILSFDAEQGDITLTDVEEYRQKVLAALQPLTSGVSIITQSMAEQLRSLQNIAPDVFSSIMEQVLPNPDDITQLTQAIEQALTIGESQGVQVDFDATALQESATNVTQTVETLGDTQSAVSDGIDTKIANNVASVQTFDEKVQQLTQTVQNLDNIELKPKEQNIKVNIDTNVSGNGNLEIDANAQDAATGNTISLTGNGGVDISVNSYAKGTKGHSGGEALVGEKGQELGILPDGRTVLLGQRGAELVSLPKGTKVVNAGDTKNILSNGVQVGKRIPAYADGTGDIIPNSTDKYDGIFGGFANITSFAKLIQKISVLEGMSGINQIHNGSNDMAAFGKKIVIKRMPNGFNFDEYLVRLQEIYAQDTVEKAITIFNKYANEGKLDLPWYPKNTKEAERFIYNGQPLGKNIPSSNSPGSMQKDGYLMTFGRGSNKQKLLIPFFPINNDIVSSASEIGDLGTSTGFATAEELNNYFAKVGLRTYGKDKNDKKPKQGLMSLLNTEGYMFNNGMNFLLALQKLFPKVGAKFGDVSFKNIKFVDKDGQLTLQMLGKEKGIDEEVLIEEFLMAGVPKNYFDNIPKFAKGTGYAHGLSLVSEKGREIVVTPDGKSEVVSQPSLVDLPKGSKVINNKDTEDILKYTGGKSSIKKFAGGTGSIPEWLLELINSGDVDYSDLTDFFSNDNGGGTGGDTDTDTNVSVTIDYTGIVERNSLWEQFKEMGFVYNPSTGEYIAKGALEADFTLGQGWKEGLPFEELKNITLKDFKDGIVTIEDASYSLQDILDQLSIYSTEAGMTSADNMIDVANQKYNAALEKYNLLKKLQAGTLSAEEQSTLEDKYGIDVDDLKDTVALNEALAGAVNDVTDAEDALNQAIEDKYNFQFAMMNQALEQYDKEYSKLKRLNSLYGNDNYLAQLDAVNDKLTKQQSNLAELIKQQEGLAIGSVAWQVLQDQIDETQNAIYDSIETVNQIKLDKITFEVDKLNEKLTDIANNGASETLLKNFKDISTIFKNMSGLGDSYKNIYKQLDIGNVNEQLLGKNNNKLTEIKSFLSEVQVLQNGNMTYKGIEYEAGSDAWKALKSQMEDFYSTEQDLMKDNMELRKEQMQYEFDMFNKKLGLDEDSITKEREALEAKKKVLEERFNKESRESLFTGADTSEYSLQNNIKNLELDRLAIDAELTGKNKELYDYLRAQTVETEDQLTMHQKQLEVLKAKIALEAALKDESIQTFTKDSVTGGWQVKYIADQDNIIDAQEALANAQLGLEEETQNQEISAKEDQLDIKEEFADRVAEIQEKALNGEYESQEDFNNAMTDLIDEFSMKYGDSWEDIYNDLSDNGVNLEGALSDLTTSVEDYYSDMGATITDFSTLVDENVNSVSSKLKELNAALQDYMEDAEDTTTTTGTTGGTGGGTGGNSGGGWTSSQTITRDFLVEQKLAGNKDVSFVEDANGYNGVRDFLQFGEDLQSGSLSFKNKSLQESFTNKYGAQISNILSLTDKTDANTQMQDLLSGFNLSKYFADSNNMTKKYYGTKTGYYTYKGLKIEDQNETYEYGKQAGTATYQIKTLEEVKEVADDTTTSVEESNDAITKALETMLQNVTDVTDAVDKLDQKFKDVGKTITEEINAKIVSADVEGSLAGEEGASGGGSLKGGLEDVKKVLEDTKEVWKNIGDAIVELTDVNLLDFKTALDDIKAVMDELSTVTETINGIWETILENITAANEQITIAGIESGKVKSDSESTLAVAKSTLSAIQALNTTITNVGKNTPEVTVAVAQPAITPYIKKFDTGGYTGESEGLAWLDKKELILKAKDTTNILDAIRLASEMERLQKTVTTEPKTKTEQNIYNIEKLEFPNVKSSDEIKKALQSLPLVAKQYSV